VRVLQDRATTNYGEPVYNVTGLVLDNGAMVVLSVVEAEDDYLIEASVVRRTKSAERPLTGSVEGTNLTAEPPTKRLSDRKG
jgi:hypothetical protein